ncbi:MAG TPA: hypothetical protein VNT53_09535 [Pseudolysinimonas sp.]|nr:hypothetical protein [Pseudolysinimonas sp.]
MRFVIAIILFVAAVASAGLGVAQRTILLGPATKTLQIQTADAPVTVVNSAALHAFNGTQRVTISGRGEVFLAYGRSDDVLAWVGDARHNTVRFNSSKHKLISAVTGTEKTVPSPVESDLWLQEYEGSKELTRSINPPSGISLIIVSDGKKAAPSTVSITWPLDQSTPMAGTLILGGIGALLLGLLALVWALVHARRRRGPRRSSRGSRPMSQRQLLRGRKRGQLPAAPVRKVILPGSPDAGSPNTGVTGAGVPDAGLPGAGLPDAKPAKKGRSRRGRGGRGRGGSLAVGLLIGSLALTGCSLGGGAAVTPTPTDTAAADLDAPVVGDTQLKRILDRVRSTVGDADAAKDPKIAAKRLDGPALADRVANYTMTRNDASQAVVAPIPDGALEIVLPEQRTTWPRTVFAVVVPPDETTAPVALVLQQRDPRDDYKVHYLINLKPGTVVPKLAPAAVGAATLPADNAFGRLRPDELAAAYGDTLAVGEKSTWAENFDLADDSLQTEIGPAAKADRLAKVQPKATIAFTHASSAESPVSFPTLDSGQLVAVALDETDTVTPVETGAGITVPANLKAYLGVGVSTTGIRATYGLQLLFYVPPLTDKSATIKVLGYTQGLVSAKEL